MKKKNEKKESVRFGSVTRTISVAFRNCARIKQLTLKMNEAWHIEHNSEQMRCRKRVTINASVVYTTFWNCASTLMPSWRMLSSEGRGERGEEGTIYL
jgi:hypothetical protein